MFKRDHTLHARKRMQQRAINEMQIRLIETFGEYHLQKGGTYIAHIPEQVLSDLRGAIERLNSVQAVFTGSNKLVTVMHQSRKTRKTQYVC
jgi:hypothetical protein